VAAVSPAKPCALARSQDGFGEFDVRVRRIVMRSKFMKMFIAAVGVFLIGAAVAIADQGKTVTMYYDTVLPNGQELKAGDYVVYMGEADHKVQFMQNKKVVAEIPCNCHSNEKKHQRTELVFQKRDDGKQELLQIKFRGDIKTIVFEASGM
jgi:hypothetical protein